MENEQAEGNKEGLKGLDHVVCGWPLVLIFIGGALGGLCGGLAYGVNAKIFSKDISKPKKYLFSLLVGFGAIIFYFIVVVILAIMFPELFAE